MKSWRFFVSTFCLFSLQSSPQHCKLLSNAVGWLTFIVGVDVEEETISYLPIDGIFLFFTSISVIDGIVFYAVSIHTIIESSVDYLNRSMIQLSR